MTAISKTEAEGILCKSGWLSLQPDKFQTEVLRRSVLMHFPAGKVVYYFGDPPGGIYGLITGTIAVDTAPRETVPRLIHLGAPGFWTGEGCFISRERRRVELRAVTETWMMHLPLDVMDQMAKREPDAARCFMRILIMNVDTLIRIIHDLQKPDATRRIASALHRASPVGGQAIALSQNELGVMANASRKQVNAALQKFSAAGWVKNSYRSIFVAEADALLRFAKGDDTE